MDTLSVGGTNSDSGNNEHKRTVQGVRNKDGGGVEWQTLSIKRGGRKTPFSKRVSVGGFRRSTRKKGPREWGNFS